MERIRAIVGLPPKIRRVLALKRGQRVAAWTMVAQSLADQSGPYGIMAEMAHSGSHTCDNAGAEPITLEYGPATV